MSRQSTKFRRYLFWIFVILAIPAAFFLISYAGGYKFSSYTSSIIQTAALSISTTPKKADVFINYTLQKGETPFFKKDILPGEYIIEIKKNNSFAWQKTLVLEQGRTTIFPNIILFQQNAAVERSAKHPQLFRQELMTTKQLNHLPTTTFDYFRKQGFSDPANLLYRDGLYILLTDQQQNSSYLFPALDQWSAEIRIDDAVRSAEWLEKNNLLLLTDHEILLFNAPSKNFTLLLRQTTPLLDVTWHPDGGYIFYSDATGLYALELDERDQRQLWQLSRLPSPLNIVVNKKGDALIFESTNKFFDLALY